MQQMQLNLTNTLLEMSHKKYGKVATMMPKPIAMDSGSGMHVNVSLWKGKENAFYDPNDEIELSQLGRYFCGGINESCQSTICNLQSNYQLLSQTSARI